MTTAELVAGKQRDSGLEVREGRFNPYTNLVHWKDGSISKVNREVTCDKGQLYVETTYLLHDIGIRERAVRAGGYP